VTPKSEPWNLKRFWSAAVTRIQVAGEYIREAIRRRGYCGAR
jgi:hypothetical protein